MPVLHNILCVLFGVEKASIDECFFDLTLPVRDLLVKRYPHLGQVPPDAPLGLDTPLPKSGDIGISWDGLGNLIPILRSEPLTRTSQVEQSGNTVAQESRGVNEEAEIGLPGNAESEPAAEPHENTWSDVVSSNLSFKPLYSCSGLSGLVYRSRDYIEITNPG